MSTAEKEMQQLEMERWVLEEALESLNQFDFAKKIPLWKKQNEIEIKMYYLIEEYPELNEFISIKAYLGGKK